MKFTTTLVIHFSRDDISLKVGTATQTEPPYLFQITLNMTVLEIQREHCLFATLCVHGSSPNFNSALDIVFSKFRLLPLQVVVQFGTKV